MNFDLARRIVFSAAVVAVWFGCAPTRAATDDLNKPQVSITTKYVDISLTIEPELQPFTELFANCLAEGKAWASKANSEAAAEWGKDPKSFRERQWYFARDYVLRSAVGPYISVVRSDGVDTGGAHPNQHADTILWDNLAHKRTNIRALFSETADNGPTMTALAQAAKLAVAAAKLANGINGYDEEPPAAQDMTPEQELANDHFIQDGIKPALLDLGPVTLAPSTEKDKSSGLTFHYSPYAVGPYVEGTYTVFVPWTVFRQYLSPQGAARFGGERPKSDEEKW